MKLLPHFIMGIILAALTLNHGIINATITFTFCFLIDIDHVLAYWHYKRFTLNPFEVLDWYATKPRKLKWMVFHIPELFIPFWIIITPINPFVVLGHATHILMDSIANPGRLQYHSLIYNWKKK